MADKKSQRNANISQRSVLKTDVTQIEQLKTADGITDSKEPNENNFWYMLQDYSIAFVLLLLALLQFIIHIVGQVVEAVVTYATAVWRVCQFCYRKPQLTKKLIVQTYELVKTSYEAEIWTFADIYNIICQQLKPMTATPTTTPTTTSPQPPATPVNKKNSSIRKKTY